MRKQKWKDGKLVGHVGKATKAQEHHTKITTFAIQNKSKYVILDAHYWKGIESNENLYTPSKDGRSRKIKCSTWLKEYHKIQFEVLQNAGYDKAFFNSMEEGWVQKQAQAIESCEAPMLEWASNWSVHIDTKSNTKSVLEQIANANGISTKELFSGKYGNSYDEMLSNLILNRK